MKGSTLNAFTGHDNDRGSITEDYEGEAVIEYDNNGDANIRDDNDEAFILGVELLLDIFQLLNRSSWEFMEPSELGDLFR